MLSIFSCACWPSICLLWKNVYSIPLLIFLIRMFGFFVEFYEFFIYSEYQPLIRYIVCKYLLSFSRLPFHFFGGFLCCAKAFYYDVVPLVYFCFCCPCLRRYIQKNTVAFYVKECSAYVSSRSFIVFSLTFGSLILF